MKGIIVTGSRVAYKPWGREPLRIATIENIEICERGEKCGRSVSKYDFGLHKDIVVDLSDGHWCYGYQIKNIINS